MPDHDCVALPTKSGGDDGGVLRHSRLRVLAREIRRQHVMTPYAQLGDESVPDPASMPRAVHQCERRLRHLVPNSTSR